MVKKNLRSHVTYQSFQNFVRILMMSMLFSLRNEHIYLTELAKNICCIYCTDSMSDGFKKII